MALGGLFLGGVLIAGVSPEKHIQEDSEDCTEKGDEAPEDRTLLTIYRCVCKYPERPDKPHYQHEDGEGREKIHMPHYRVACIYFLPILITGLAPIAVAPVC